MSTRKNNVAVANKDDEVVTRRILKEELKDVVRKKDLGNFATKDDLRNELKNYPTKDDLKNALKNYPTKDDLRNELKKYATKDDLKNLERRIDGRFDELAVMIQNSFNGVDYRIGVLSTEVKELNARVSDIEIRIDRLEKMFWGFSERFEDFKQEWELWASKREQRQIKTELKKYQYVKNDSKKDRLAFRVLRGKVTRLEEKVAKLEKEKARN